MMNTQDFSIISLAGPDQSFSNTQIRPQLLFSKSFPDEQNQYMLLCFFSSTGQANQSHAMT
jgi:hypothetical protein